MSRTLLEKIEVAIEDFRWEVKQKANELILQAEEELVRSARSNGKAYAEVEYDTRTEVNDVVREHFDKLGLRVTVMKPNRHEITRHMRIR